MRWAEAVPLLRQLTVLQPESPAALHVYAAALANSGQLEEAHTTLARAQRLAPQDANIQKSMADLERKRRAVQEGATPTATEEDGGS